MKFLEVKEVSLKNKDSIILNKVSFTQKKFQRIAIAGETGSGKSSLLKIINGSGEGYEGTVYFEDNRVKDMSEKLVPGHPGIAYLSQYFELPKSLTVAQVLSYANQLTEARAKKLYKICQIDYLLERRTDQVSGGEKQRIALARLLSTSPELLLLDEPFSNLDMPHKNQLKKVIDAVTDQLGISCIVVSHEPTDTLSWADHIIVMKDGEIVQQGSPDKIYHKPVNEYVAGLFGSYQLLSAEDSISDFPLKKNKDLFVRSEYLKLKHKGSASIHQIKFYGSYKEAIVKTNDAHFLRVRLTSDEFKIGDKVEVMWTAHEPWFLLNYSPS